MSHVKVRYDYGFNNSGTGQHEVIEYVLRYPRAPGNSELEEGPYVVLYTEQKFTAEAIALLLNADGACQAPNTLTKTTQESEWDASR